MRVLKNLVKQIPGAKFVIRRLAEMAATIRLKIRAPQDIFTEYYESNAWGHRASRSGPGSSLEVTIEIRKALPSVWRQLDAKTILDIPCGDFHWMKEIDLSEFYYIGGDVVGEIIENNTRRHAGKNITFGEMNIIEGPLPQADLIICRDCLVHFSFAHIVKSLANIRSSNSKWLMTTHFPETKSNVEIATGQWRPVNLTLPPFNFQEPHILLREISEKAIIEMQNTEENEEFLNWMLRWKDKSLGVWKISDLPFPHDAPR